MKGAIAPLSTQMQHENAKYRNADTSVGRWPARVNGTGLDDMDSGCD
jgi:hypothetical protein